MAGKAAKALKVAIGATAGVTLGAGVYYLGKQAGIDEAATASTGAGTVVSTKTVGAPQSSFKDTPRPIMEVPAEEIPRVARDRQAYHELINDRARDLRSRIAEQAYATVLADAESDANGQVQAEGVEVLEDEPSTKRPDKNPTASMVSEPYERIQDALKTSKLFKAESDEAYKPTPFSMPKS